MSQAGTLPDLGVTETQRALIANKIANMRVGRNWDNSANLHNKVSRKEAADIMNVSERTS